MQGQDLDKLTKNNKIHGISNGTKKIELGDIEILGSGQRINLSSRTAIDNSYNIPGSSSAGVRQSNNFKVIYQNKKNKNKERDDFAKKNQTYLQLS